MKRVVIFVFTLLVFAVAPAKTDKVHIERMNDEVRKALVLPDTRDKLAAVGADAAGGGSDEFGAFLRTETARWAKVVKVAGIKVE